jgi:hypothetical protein
MTIGSMILVEQYDRWIEHTYKVFYTYDISYNA